MSGRAIIFALTLLGSIGAWTETRAQAQAHPAPRARVLLVLDRNIESSSGFSDALSGQLADLDVEISSGAADGSVPGAALALARANRSPRDRGVVWVAIQGTDLLVFVVEPAAEKTLLRALPNADPSQFATQETVAVIVRSSIQGLLSGAPIGFIASSAAPSPGASRRASTAAAIPFVPELSVGYVGASLANEIPWQQGARLAVGLAHLWSEGPYAQLALSLLRDERVVDQGVSLLLTRMPIEANLGFRITRAGFAIAPELSAGLDIMTRDAQATSANVDASARNTRISTFLGGHLWLLRALGGPDARAWLAIGGGIEAVLNNVDYRVEIRRGSEPSSRPILVSPRSFRPIASISLQVSL